MDNEKRSVVIKGKKVDYYVTKKKIKNMSMRLSDNGEILISIPRYLPYQKAEDFLVSKYSWVEKQLVKYNKYADFKESTAFKEGDIIYLLGNSYKLRLFTDIENHINVGEGTIDFFIKEKYVDNKEYIQRYYEKWTKEYCYLFCIRFIDKYKPLMSKYNVPNEINVEIKKFKAKWGACTPSKKKVAFNMNLVKVPLSCLEYVVVHELAHFKHLNHSQSFYDLVEKFIPDWKQRRKILNEKYGRVLI